MMMNGLSRNKERRRNRRRLAASLLVMAVMVGFVLATSNVLSARTSSEFITVVVQHGDTLWDIAVRNSTGRDVRYVVWEIRKRNGLEEDVRIHPGQVLQVPIS